MDALTYAGNTANIADLLGHERLAFVEGDIRDAAHVEEVVAGVDVDRQRRRRVARREVDPRRRERVRDHERRGHAGPARRAAGAHPVERFILVSSSEVYGTAESDPMDEEHPLNPRSPYAATKAGGDRLVYSYWCTYGTPAVVVRPFNNYGPYQHPEKVIPRFITAALQDRPLTVHGGGTREPGLAARRGHLGGDRRASSTRRSSASRARSLNVATGRRRRRPEHRRAHLRQPRQAALADPLRRRPAGPGRPPHRLDRQGRASSSAGAPASASTRASSARSAGTPTTRPGGRRTSSALG